MRQKEKKQNIAESGYPKSREGFSTMVFQPTNQKENPSCFNGEVYVRRYKTTIELIDEPIEVIQNRIQTLWDKSENYHDHRPLEAAAMQYNYKLIGTRGNKAAKK